MSSVDDFIGAERILAISSRCHIRFSDERLIVERREDGLKVELPLAEVLAVVLESEQATVTAAVLAACGEKGVPVIACRKHRPVSLGLSLDQGWNGAEIRRAQARALRGDAPARRLWRRTVRAKLFAQAATVKAMGGDTATRIRQFAASVALDGVETVEAQAAAIYWRDLFDDFERQDDKDPRNALLNWGYAVLLAAIGRALVAQGLDPALGFGHSGQSNSWALACDLMEPYRPSVDRIVAGAGGQDAAEVKAALLLLFRNDGIMKRDLMRTVRGYKEFLDDGNETAVPYPDGPLLA